MTTKKILVTSLKWILVTLPFIWIFSRIDIKALTTAFTMVAWWTIPVMVFNILLAMFLQGFRWWVLLRGPFNDLSLGTALRYHFYGVFYSIVLPGSAAQDLVKTALIARRFSYSEVWGATWTFKLLGLLSLVILSIYGLLTIDYESYSLQQTPTRFVFIFLGIMIILVVLSFSKKFTRPIRRLFSRFIPPRFLSVMENIRQGIYQYKNRPLRLAVSFGLSFLTQAVLVINSVLVIKGICGTFYFNECFAFIPIIEILCMIIPLTPNGTGIRESLATVMFTRLGLSNEQIAIYVALSGLVPVVLKLVGALPIIIAGKPEEKNAPVK